MPITRITSISAIMYVVSPNSRLWLRNCPRLGRLAICTISSPASSERQANAQPCFSPETMLGSAAGMTTCR